tara:strand:- start:1560 stop:2045 length:486 start_codon:yes stop_codon:yes gene_type:complete
MKRILYLHGLESAQGGKKVDFLANKGYVYAPEMDYTRRDIFPFLLNVVEEFKPDIIVGSSMGGYLAYVFGGLYQIPVLAFNPALHSRIFNPIIPDFVKKHYPSKMTVVVGEEDTIISADDTLRYITDHMAGNVTGITVERVKTMGHRTTLSVFSDMYNKTI